MAMRSALLSRLVAGACLVSGLAHAEVSCPTYQNGARLTQYTVFDGDPVNEVSLWGEQGPKDDQWLLEPLDTPPENYYVVCTYLHGSDLTLKLPLTMKVCTQSGSAFIPNVVCK